MSTNRVRYVHVAASIFGAGLVLVVLLATLAGARTRAAPPHRPANDDPSIEAITVTSGLAISDTHPGAATDKTVYFNNVVPGAITLTFEIEGPPTLTLAAGTAFSEPVRVYTATASPLITDVVYPVSITHGSQGGVVYTATDGTAAQTTVAITYVRDVTAPSSRVDIPVHGGYYSTPFTISGVASDTGRLGCESR